MASTLPRSVAKSIGSHRPRRGLPRRRRTSPSYAKIDGERRVATRSYNVPVCGSARAIACDCRKCFGKLMSRNDGKPPVSLRRHAFGAETQVTVNTCDLAYGAERCGGRETAPRDEKHARARAEEKRGERQKWDDRRACFRNSTIFDAVARGNPRRKETGEIFTRAPQKPIERYRGRGRRTRRSPR